MPQQALATYAEMLGPMFQNVQRIRFIDFVRTDQADFRYTIALCWTFSDYAIRETLYQRAADLVAATGWYPLPAGERLASRREMESLPSADPSIVANAVAGPLHAIEAAVPSDGGCCIRIGCSRGSILLDTGLPDYLRPAPSDRIALISHAHRDHYGGLSALPESVPIVTSPETARILEAFGALPRQVMKRTVLFHDQEQVQVGEGVWVRCFPVPHFPGSCGFQIDDGRRTVFYTGDVCLRSHRHDFTPVLEQILQKSERRDSYLLIDAAMTGRNLEFSLQDPAQAVLHQLGQSKDVVITGWAAEQLLYAYLDLFHKILRSDSRGRVGFLMSSKLKALFRVLHASFVGRDFERLDRFILAQYGKTMSAWGESRFVYWLDGSANVPSDGSRIWFVGHDELGSIQPQEPVALANIGRLEAPSPLPWGSEPTRLDLNGPAWGLHSDEAGVLDAMPVLARHSRLLLFHNFPKRLRKLRRQTDVPFDPVSEIPLAIS